MASTYVSFRIINANISVVLIKNATNLVPRPMDTLIKSSITATPRIFVKSNANFVIKLAAIACSMIIKNTSANVKRVVNILAFSAIITINAHQKITCMTKKRKKFKSGRKISRRRKGD